MPNRIHLRAITPSNQVGGFFKYYHKLIKSDTNHQGYASFKQREDTGQPVEMIRE